MRGFLSAHAQLRLRETNLGAIGAGVLACAGIVAGFGLVQPHVFGVGGRASGLAAFLLGPYRVAAAIAVLGWGTAGVLAGVVRLRDLDTSLVATPGAGLVARADLLATVLVFAVTAALPLPLYAWAWRLGVVDGMAFADAAILFAVVAVVGVACVYLGERVSKTYGGALSVALLVEGALVAAWLA